MLPVRTTSSYGNPLVRVLELCADSHYFNLFVSSFELKGINRGIEGRKLLLVRARRGWSTGLLSVRCHSKAIYPATVKVTENLYA